MDYFLYNFCRSRYGFLLYLQMARQKNEKMTISLLKNLELQLQVFWCTDDDYFLFCIRIIPQNLSIVNTKI